MFLWQQAEERIQRSADILFTNELLNAAKSQILGVFINSFDELFKQLSMDFPAPVDVSSMVPEIVTAALAMTLKDRDIDI